MTSPLLPKLLFALVMLICVKLYIITLIIYLLFQTIGVLGFAPLYVAFALSVVAFAPLSIAFALYELAFARLSIACALYVVAFAPRSIASALLSLTSARLGIRPTLRQ